MSTKNIIIKTNRSTNYLVLHNKDSSIPMLFLHGFTGTGNSWDEVIGEIDCYSIALDIVGHGKSTFSDLISNYSANDWCDELDEILNSLNINKLNIYGYSMGGRLAIAFADKYPKKINRLILESTGLGIDDKKTKNQRFQEDLDLSRLIESDLNKFLQKWERNPLFSMQRERNEEGFLAQREERQKHDPMQLSKALKIFGQGAMKSYELEFSQFNFPISIINGNEDEKYIKIGEKMCQLNANCSQQILKGVHNVHLENPKNFVNTLEKALNSTL